MTPQEALALEYNLTPEEIDRACRWAVIAKETAKERARIAAKRAQRTEKPLQPKYGPGPKTIKAVPPKLTGIWCEQCDRRVSYAEGQSCTKKFCKAGVA